MSSGGISLIISLIFPFIKIGAQSNRKNFNCAIVKIEINLGTSIYFITPPDNF
jgi:hypothetical protein